MLKRVTLRKFLAIVVITCCGLGFSALIRWTGQNSPYLSNLKVAQYSAPRLDLVDNRLRLKVEMVNNHAGVFSFKRRVKHIEFIREGQYATRLRLPRQIPLDYVGMVDVYAIDVKLPSGIAHGTYYPETDRWVLDP